MENRSHHTDVVVIGAGQAGLATSYYLALYGVNHVVLERGRIGESWRSQRWDSFALNTPTWCSLLPQEHLNGRDPDGFMSRQEYVDALNAYAVRFRLAVRENVCVVSLEKAPGGDGFIVRAKDHGADATWHCRQVVIASGMMSRPKWPAVSAQFPDYVRQLHAADYRSPDALPKGNVLVVGSGQSGCEIAEDLLDAGRTVFLSTSYVGRVPRRYRNQDILFWLIATGLHDVRTDAITDPAMLVAPQPLSSGTGPRGHSISLQQLHRRGITLLGRLKGVQGEQVSFANDAADNVRFGDRFSAAAKRRIDEYLEKELLEAAPVEDDEGDRADPQAASASALESLDLTNENVTSVIWSVGFDADFSWIRLPIIDAQGLPIHQEGVTSVPGVLFVGFPWLRKRKSGIIYGIAEDAEFIATEVARVMQAASRGQARTG